MKLRTLALRATCLSIAAAILVGTAHPSSGEPSAWPESVEGFVAPKAGEHPRLLFRKSDVKELQKKAETDVGKAMVGRLKYLLGGGEDMPGQFNPNPPLNIGPKGPGQLKPGAFTVNHAAGFGLLYQLTENGKYADLARQCLEKVFEGQVDRDERYSWKAPGTGFRISGVLQGVAIAYDLCYDGWDDEYRKSVLKKIQDLGPKTVGGKRGPYTLEVLARGGNYPPSSNHYGAYISGPGIAALAIQGDPGADDDRLEKILRTVESSMKTVLTKGYGDGGWFGEGTGSDKTAMQPGLLGLIQSMRVAAGRDWCQGAPNARMIMLTRVLEFIDSEDGVRRPMRGYYSHGPHFWPGGTRDRFRDRGGWSADGLFCIGMGALPDPYRPGMKWVYENFVEPDTDPTKRIYEARIDPLHAVYAFVNWPLDAKAENPAKAFPLAVRDSLHGYVLCRSGFSGPDDVLFTGLCRTGPTGYHKVRPPQDVIVWASGYKVTIGRFGRSGIGSWNPGADGSATFVNGKDAWAIDYSGTSGCKGLVATTSSRGPRVTPPAPKFDPVADDKIDLTGAWTDGGPIRVEQNGKDLTVTFGTVRKRVKKAYLKGRRLNLVWNKSRTLVGTVSEDAQTVQWNGGVWTRVIKRPRWKYKEGEKVKVSTVTVGKQKVHVITFDPEGKHPEAKVEGNTILVGKQKIQLTGGELKLATFQPADGSREK